MDGIYVLFRNYSHAPDSLLLKNKALNNSIYCKGRSKKNKLMIIDVAVRTYNWLNDKFNCSMYRKFSFFGLGTIVLL